MFLNKLAEEDKADVRKKEDVNTRKEKGGGLVEKETRKGKEKEEGERQKTFEPVRTARSHLYPEAHDCEHLVKETSDLQKEIKTYSWLQFSSEANCFTPSSQ